MTFLETARKLSMYHLAKPEPELRGIHYPVEELQGTSSPKGQWETQTTDPNRVGGWADPGDRSWSRECLGEIVILYWKRQQYCPLLDDGVWLMWPKLWFDLVSPNQPSRDSRSSLGCHDWTKVPTVDWVPWLSGQGRRWISGRPWVIPSQLHSSECATLDLMFV